jgi:TonB family protein
MPVAMLALLSVPAPPLPFATQRTEVVSFTASDVTCSGQPITVDSIVQPFTAVATRYGPAVAESPPPAYRFSFAIDAQGRARTIRRDTTEPSRWYVDTSDLAPALAASSFPTGMPRAKCTVSFKVSVVPIEKAPMPALYELASRPDTTGFAPALFERVLPAGSNCPREPGQYRRLNLPAFEKLSQPARRPAWVFLAFDVNAAGKPGNVQTLGTSGETGLERAGREALLANRYEPGAGFHGCTYHFYHNGGSHLAAPVPVPDTPLDTGDQPGCVVDPKSIPGLLDGSAYPRAFGRRGIEGAAVIGYDTAPWGAVGNVSVLSSEPDEAFGDTARNALSNARVVESGSGRRGCVQRVQFKLPPKGTR